VDRNNGDLGNVIPRVKYTRAGGRNIRQLDRVFESSTAVCLVEQHMGAVQGAFGYKRSIQATCTYIFIGGFQFSSTKVLSKCWRR
jgi:hypothetical protein